MTRVTARFDVDLPGELLVGWPEEKEIVFKQVIDGFEVEIQFDNEWAASRKLPEEQNIRYSFSKAMVYVSREEEETPPSIKADETGRRDYSEARIYFDERRMEYGKLAYKVTNRMIRYFKYVMKTPKLFEISREHDCFRNATSTDSLANDYRHGGTQFGTMRISAEEGKLGRQRLIPELKETFFEALEESIIPSLGEEILSDVQTAFFADNIRRAVLELAIASEIVVKRKYFSDETPAGAAFDYLEDKSLG